MSVKKLLIFIVAYNADKTLESVINRIPAEMFDEKKWLTHVLVIDDASHDQTFHVGRTCKVPEARIEILKNPANLGYGGNQKLGYRYALDQGFDIVALLHGDGQYAPEKLPELVESFSGKSVGAVFGSRMMVAGEALRGGMPFYKYCGNKILTFLQNKMVGTELSEYHSGYRLYSCKALRKIPFEQNANGFDFDTDIILQLHRAGIEIKELPIPTFYGDEICYVNGVQYGLRILMTCLMFSLQDKGVFYQAKFDIEQENEHYEAKFDFCSSHSLAMQAVEPGEKILSLGAGPAEVVKPFADKGAIVTAVDCFISDEVRRVAANVVCADLDAADFKALTAGESYSKVLALDIIEHLKSPEHFLTKLRNTDAVADAEFVFTTPNIAFLPIRLMLLCGGFNYGKRGILDRTHTRLFTFSSFLEILDQQGFQVIEVRGVPAPFPLAFGRNQFAALLLWLNNAAIKLFRGAFSYQIFIRARAVPTTERLLANAHAHSEKLALTAFR